MQSLANKYRPKIVLKNLLVLLSIFISVSLISQEYRVNFHFRHLTSNDGLSSNRINCIFEDDDNFIWFGTEDGLNLYDGVSVKEFKTDDEKASGLTHNTVYCIEGDPKNGNLWIGTKEGVCYFDKETYSFFEIPIHGENENFSIQNAFDLTFDQNDDLWISTTSGLFYYKTRDKSIVRYIHDPGNDNSIIANGVNEVFIYDDSKVFVSTRSGLDLLDTNTGIFHHLFPEEGPLNVKKVFKDSHEQYWVCTDYNGLYRMEAGDEPELVRENFGNDLLKNTDRIQTIVEDDQKNLFICARDKGLFYYNRKLEKLTFYEPDRYNPNGLNSKALLSAYKSTSGIIWFSTFSNGVNYIDYNRKPFEHYKINYKNDGLLNNNTRSFFQDAEGIIWIGTKEGGGLSRFYPRSGRFKNYSVNAQSSNSISSDYILSINELDERTLILGTLKQGIDLFDKRTETFRNIKIPNSRGDLTNNNIYAIYKDLSDSIWIATLSNLYYFDAKKTIFKEVQGVRSVKCIEQNSKSGGLWFGTKFNGLINFRGGKARVFEQIDSLNSISSNDITSLCFESDSLLWIGTSNGLNLLNVETQEIITWFEKDGLPSNKISAIEIDERGLLWISTANGLSNFNRDEGIFKNYFVSDGLQGNEFETYISLKANDGAMYFGGSNGFNRFYPNEIKDNLEIPEIHFADFKIANKSVGIDSVDSPLSKHIDKTNRIKLKYNEADFTFEFIALNYTSPEKNTYRYMLEGYDNDWIYSERNRVATYTNIEAGDYTFKVTGSNNDQYWNERVREVQLTVLPPPWKSVYAYIIYVLLIGVLAYLFYASIVSRIEHENQMILERQEREKLEQINQIKLRFFTNISHEFRTPLTLIASPLSKLMKDEDIAVDERYYLHQTMNKNVKRLLRLIKQLMDFRKLENKQLKIKVKQGNLSLFVSEIIDGFKEFATSKQIDIIYQPDVEEDEQCWFDHHALDGVIFNLLSNALKFSNAESEIQVSVHKTEDGFAEIEIRDFGAGIRKENLGKIFERFYSDDQGMEGYSGTGIGLAFSKNMITLHHGDIIVNSELNKGSTFTVRIPVTRDSYGEEEILESRITEEGAERIAYREEHAAESIKRFVDDHPDGSVSGEGRKPSLLIAEDNEELRKFLKIQLSQFRIIEVGDGEEALKKAMEHLPEIIISDVMMPKMNGIELCKALKQDHRTSHIPVILLTAKTALEHKIEGIEQGADAYMEKPFDVSLLEAQLNNLLSQREILRERFKNHTGLSLTELTTNRCDQQFFEKAEKIVNEHLSDDNFSVDDLGEKLLLSRSQLFRKFKNVTGYNPSEYIRIKRIDLAKELLKQGVLNVNEVSERTGFKTSSYFISIFKKNTGFTPREYLRK